VSVLATFTPAWVCNLALGAALSGSPLAFCIEVIPGRLEKATKGEAFFRTCTMLSTVASHYNDIDLQAIGKSFTNNRSDEELDALQRVAAPAAEALARLVSPNGVLHGHKEEEWLGLSFFFSCPFLYPFGGCPK
jgi:hypothetical protein